MCTSNADCLFLLYELGNVSSGLRDWCVQRVECNPHYHECVAWPRCVNWPYWGCMGGQQLCVNYWDDFARATDGVPNVTLSFAASLETPAVLIPLILFAIVLFITAIGLVICFWKDCHCTPRAKNQWPAAADTYVPLVSLDRPATTTTMPEETVRDPYTWEQLYNQHARDF